MKAKLIAILAVIIALVFGGSATAVASPYTQTKTVTYTVSVTSGSPVETMIYYQGSSGMTWTMTDELPWRKTFKMAKSAMPNVYFYSMVSWTESPTYTCSITVNGVTKVPRPSQMGQCLQSYEY